MLEGQEGLEPSTPCLRGRCSNQLSYWPKTSRTCEIIAKIAVFVKWVHKHKSSHTDKSAIFYSALIPSGQAHFCLNRDTVRP